jgi:hypothetical protein
MVNRVILIGYVGSIEPLRYAASRPGIELLPRHL